MSTYKDYVTARLRHQQEEETTHKDDATAEDYEAALAQLGVETDEEDET